MTISEGQGTRVWKGVREKQRWGGKVVWLRRPRTPERKGRTCTTLAMAWRDTETESKSKGKKNARIVWSKPRRSRRRGQDRGGLTHKGQVQSPIVVLREGEFKRGPERVKTTATLPHSNGKKKDSDNKLKNSTSE